MTTQTKLIEDFNQARETVRKLLPAINANMEIYPGWTIKEVLAHLAGWDNSTIQALQSFKAGEPPQLTAMNGLDVYNSQSVAEHKELTLDQTVNEWESVRGQLLPLIEQLTDADLAALIVAPWGQSISVLQLLSIMVGHEEEHAEIIQARMDNPNEPPHEH